MLVPAMIWFVARRDSGERSQRLRLLAYGGLVALGLVAPYLISCAMEFGDPLYAINDHTRFYLGREGLERVTVSASDYVLGKWRARPVETTDTAIRGVFVYPFQNKWDGFDAWQPGFGTLLEWLAVAGLVSWLWTDRGRFLLSVLLGSLVPYMLTWPIPGGYEWRFTLHAYPLYLLAAVSVFTWPAALIARQPSGSIRWRRAVMPVAATTGLAAAGLLWWWGMPYLVAKETLAQGRPLRISVGDRDRIFLGGDWTAIAPTRNVVSRLSTSRRSTIRFPLPERRDYDLVLRIDPLPLRDGAPADRARVAFNGHSLGSLSLQWDATRVGSYTLRLPGEQVKVGANSLTLDIDRLVEAWRVRRQYPSAARSAQQVGIRFWYLVVTPAHRPAGGDSSS
jgi:hypothetical protein